MRPIVNIFAITMSAVVLSACTVWSHQTATRSESHTTAHMSNTPIVVEARNGSIEIIADKSVSDVQIDATLRCVADTQAKADELLTLASVSVSRDTSKVLTIKAILPAEDQNRHGASFKVRLPDADGVTARSSNGKVVIAGLSGELIADTSNGSVSVTDHDGSVRIDTSNGSVKALRIAGSLTVDTSNGGVDAEDVGGPVKIDTSNGSIAMKMNPDHTGPLHLDSSNGSISATIGKRFAGVIRLDTSNGSITVKDHGGRITSQTLSKNSGQLTVGEGGETSIIDTSNGRIEVVIAN